MTQAQRLMVKEKINETALDIFYEKRYRYLDAFFYLNYTEQLFSIEEEMAQVQKQAVKERIYDVALDIFYDKGYKDATMREIAERAEIPVGLIYTYYKNKAELLEAIVEPVFEVLSSYMDRHWGGWETWENCFEETRAMLMKLAVHLRKAALIGFEKCAGTKYENTKERIISVVEEHIAGERRCSVDGFEEFHAKILATSFVESFVAIVRRYDSQEWAERMVTFLIDTLAPKKMA